VVHFVHEVTAYEQFKQAELKPNTIHQQTQRHSLMVIFLVYLLLFP